MQSQFHLIPNPSWPVGAEIGNDMGDRDTWSEADLAARAVAKGMLRDDALLRKCERSRW